MKNFLRILLVKTCLVLTALISLNGCDFNNSSSNNSINANTTPAPQPSITEPEEVLSSLSITLSWTPPATRENGDTLKMADIGGYEIISERDNVQIESITISAANVTAHTFADLSPANYAFSIYTYDNQNQISQSSAKLNLNKTQFPTL